MAKKVESGCHWVLSGEKLIKQGPRIVTLGVKDAINPKLLKKP